MRSSVLPSKQIASKMTNAFRIDPGFVSRVIEWYGFEQEKTREAREDWERTHPDGQPAFKSRKAVPSRSIRRHIRSLLEEAFWASLRTEEGRFHGFALEYAPEPSGLPSIAFKESRPFNSRELGKVAPALTSDQIIRVWPSEIAGGKSDLRMWGFSRKLDSSSLWLKTIGPGKIVLSIGYFEKSAIDSQRADFVSELSLSRVREIFQRARRGELASEHYFAEACRARDLEIIARAMPSHGKGGTLLVVRDLGQSIEELRYPVKPDETVTEYLHERDCLLEEGRFGGDPEFFRIYLESVGQVTAVDGAALVTNELSLLGFGAKTRPVSDEPFTLRLSGPFDSSEPKNCRSDSTLMNWGTRHKSAARFIFDNRDALAIVASQDGRLSMFAWDESKGVVSVIEEAEFLLL
jgi:hypothetical protein